MTTRRRFAMLALVGWVLTLVSPPQGIAAQDRDPAARQPSKPQVSVGAHQEVPGDDYVPITTLPRETVTSPGARLSRNGYTAVQVNVNALGQNIVGDAANEPSIAVDPTNPNRIAIGWRQFDTTSSNFRQAGWAYSADGGETWTFPGRIEPGVFRSDPVLVANADGDFFYNSLTVVGDDFYCDVFKSTNGGATWDSGVYAFGGDKQWMTADLTDGIGRNNLYAFWTSHYSCCPGHFTRSYDGGQTWTSTIDVPGSPFWGTLTVDPDGALYIAGSGFVVAKSSTLQDETLPAAWDFSQFVDLGGSLASSGGPNPGGLLGQAWIAADHSGGPHHGNIYLLASVRTDADFDPADVMFVRSTDGGQTWSQPVRVNDDFSHLAYQWFGTLSVGPTGRIDVVWLDNRADPGEYDSVLYYSYSVDAGETWAANQALTPSFDPHVGWPNQNKMGDYFDMISDETGAHLAFAATFNGEQDVYYIHLTPDLVAPTPDPMTFETPPQPFINTTFITMTAAAATDTLSPPVRYWFELLEGGPGSASSLWQIDRTYTDGGLAANTVHTYRVRGRDSAEPPNYTGYSAPVTTATHIETPAGVAFGAVTSSTVELTATGTLSNLDSGDSGVWFDSLIPGGNGGISTWVSGSGDVATGLSPDAEYEFRVKARNASAFETEYSPHATVVTLSATAAAPVLERLSCSALSISLGPDANPPTTTYAVFCAQTTPADPTWQGKFVSVTGVPAGGFADWQSALAWDTVVLNDLVPETTYSFRVLARNREQTLSPAGPEGSLRLQSCGDSDMDGDGAVDLRDFAAWQDCLGVSPVELACEPADVQGDGQVDLSDFAEFSERLTGPA